METAARGIGGTEEEFGFVVVTDEEDAKYDDAELEKKRLERAPVAMFRKGNRSKVNISTVFVFVRNKKRKRDAHRQRLLKKYTSIIEVDTIVVNSENKDFRRRFKLTSLSVAAGPFGGNFVTIEMPTLR